MTALPSSGRLLEFLGTMSGKDSDGFYDELHDEVCLSHTLPASFPCVCSNPRDTLRSLCLRSLVPRRGLRLPPGNQMPMPTHESLRGVRPYDVLLEKLKHPNAAEVVKRLELFVAQFEGTDIMVSSNAPNEVQAQIATRHWVPGSPRLLSPDEWLADQADRPWNVIRSFLGHLYSQMRESPLWWVTHEFPVAVRAKNPRLLLTHRTCTPPLT